MSANQKQIRQGQYAAKLARRKEAEEKAAKEARTWKIRAIIIFAVIVVLTAAVLILNSGVLYRLPAVKLGDTTYSAAELNYFYSTSYNSFANQYGDYLSYFFNTDEALDKQIFDEETGETWKDYFIQQAEVSAQWVTMHYDEAMAAGYTISEDGKAAVDANMSYSQSYADMYQVSLERYLRMQYGAGVTEKLVRELLTRAQTASEFYTQQYDSYSYDAAATETYYTAHADELSLYSYYYYFFGGAADEANGITAEAAMAAAKEAADGVEAASSTLDGYISALFEATGEAPHFTTQTGANIATYGENYPAWVTDLSRQEGDVAVIEETDGYYVLYWQGLDDNHYQTRDIYYVYMEAGTDAEGNYVDEAIENTRLVAEAMMTDEWDGTVENLASLASSYSDDTTYSDGHVEHCAKGTVDSSFDAYLFGDDALADGEYVVYPVESGVYVIYVVGDGGQYSDVLAEQALRDADYSAWQDAKLANYDVVELSGLKFVG